MPTLNVAISMFGDISVVSPFTAEARLQREDNMEVVVSIGNFVHKTQDIGTAAEKLEMSSELTLPAYVFCKNLGDDFLFVGGETTQDIKLGAGEICFFQWNRGFRGNFVWAKASSTTRKLEYIIIAA